VKILEGFDFSRLPADLEPLFRQGGRESFFNLAGWYWLISECAVADRSRAGLAVDDGKMVALAFRRAPRERNLRSCTSMYTCAYDVLCDRASASTVRAFARAFVSSVRPLDYLCLEGLDPGNFHFSALVDGFRAAGFVAKPYFGWGTWFEPTLGIDFENYLSRRPSILRNTWKRKCAALGKVADAKFRICGPSDDPEIYIADFERIREQSWKAAEPDPDFVPGLIRFAASQNALRFGILDIGGTPAAAQFWIVWSGRATIYKLVYAERFASYCPGPSPGCPGGR
jgi:hypothetical protein